MWYRGLGRCGLAGGGEHEVLILGPGGSEYYLSVLEKGVALSRSCWHVGHVG